MAARVKAIIERGTHWWSQRTLSQRFVTLTALLIAAGAIIQGAVLVGVAAHIVRGLETERAAERLDKAAGQFYAHVSEFRKVPLILAGTPPVERIVDLSTGGAPRVGESLEVWRERLSIAFRSIVQANPSLMQARLIGLADGGREIVRVNRLGQSVMIAERADLQRKGNRPYFRETAKLHAGDVYLSPINANVENKVVVRPFQPMLRAATPIFADTGALFGIIVANASPDTWLRDISALSGLSENFVVANQDGDYFFRTDGGPIFGSHGQAGSRFRHEWPKLASLLKDSGNRTLKLREGNKFVAAHRVDYNPARPDEFVVLAANSDASTVFGGTWSLILLGAAIALAMSVFGVLAAHFVSRPLKGLMSAARRIAEGKLNVTALTENDQSADIGELGEALRIMKQAVGSRDSSLRKSEANLQAIVDNTIDGLITFDPRGTIQRYNHACENIFGYTSSEAIGQNVNFLMPRSETKRLDGHPRRPFRIGIAKFVGVRREVRGRRKDGHLIDLEVAIAEIKVEDEVLFTGIVRDITERKKIDQIKGEFISTVSHELRTPLTSIIGSLGLLCSGALGQQSAKAQRMLNLAHDNGARLVKIINDILDFDKIEAGRLEFSIQPENLQLLLRRAAEHNAAHAAEHGATVLVEEMDGDIVVGTDSDRFHQVMASLISNAAKFSPKGGQITIAAKKTGDIVRISISDQGPGIPAAFREHIFEKFAHVDSSDKREKGGTGLGLSIAKAIVERLGGNIGFETQAGVGTTFHFTLPAHVTAPDAELARQAS